MIKRVQFADVQPIVFETWTADMYDRRGSDVVRLKYKEFIELLNFRAQLQRQYEQE